MKAQEKAWSKHDLEGFMKGYWKNDSLKFFGSRGMTYGWNQTLANYKKGYPTKEHREAIKKYGVTKYHRTSFRLLPEQYSLHFTS